MHILLIILLTLPLIASAAAPSINLQVRGNDSGTRLTMNLSASADLTECGLAIYSSGDRTTLLKNPIGGTKVLALHGGEQTRSIKANSLLGPTSSVFFRAEVKCGTDSSLSKVSKIRGAPQTGSGPIALRPYLNLLRKRLLVSSLSIEQVYQTVILESPIDLRSPNDGTGRIFIAEQTGKIKVFSGIEPSPTASTFLDISSKIVTGPERGLLGFAFHPSFSTNGYFFVFYSRAIDGASIVARYQVDSESPNLANPDSELIILAVDQPFITHKGGALAFGPDGYLYIPLGDGGSAGDPLGHGQNLETLLGKILRIDVDSNSSGLNYSIPTDNPFISSSAGVSKEIYAYGFRNPWRISFDSQNGSLWAGDVGQNLREEIDKVTAGGNYGWNIMEGKACFNQKRCNSDDLIQPVVNYGRSVGQAVTGGYVYRGTKIPALQGKYIYADFMTGVIFAIDSSRRAPNPLLIKDTDLFISSFGTDWDEELYLLSYLDGEIYKFK